MRSVWVTPSLHGIHHSNDPVLGACNWSSGLTIWDTLHFTSPKLQFYDKQLSPKVSYARHAISIDEHRKDFDRVPWGMLGAEMPIREGGKFFWFK